MIAVTYEPSAVIVDCQPKPTAATSVPSTATLRAPITGMKRGAAFEPRTTASELGTTASPAPNGE